MRFLRPFECFPGMFQGLLGELVSRQVILFSVVRCRSAMRVCRQFMKFRSSPVGIVWHRGPLFTIIFIFEPISFSSCPIPDTSVFFAESSLDGPIPSPFHSLPWRGRADRPPSQTPIPLYLNCSSVQMAAYSPRRSLRRGGCIRHLRVSKKLMKTLRLSLIAFAFVALPQAAAAQDSSTLAQVVDKIVAQEQAETQSFRQYSPLVETYIQYFRTDKHLGTAPAGDKYFLGRAELARGVEVEPLINGKGSKHKILGSFNNFFATEFLPQGFLQMIYVDVYNFDRGHYKFEYVRREFLGDVRCLVFDVDPVSKSDKGRFVGRIWVEDQDYHIVRFNGAYGGSSLISNYFNFDSWRANAGKNQWLPAFIYSQEGDVQDPQTKRLAFKPFRAQTRLWGYNLGHVREEQELNKVLVEAPVKDEAEMANDYSPLQAQRSWGRQAEDNLVESMERLGLLAPHGDVDKVLETVVNNLEVSNNLDIEPDVRCRVLMISTLESFTVGHTIVLSRGLVDVLPDEASLRRFSPTSSATSSSAIAWTRNTHSSIDCASMSAKPSATSALRALPKRKSPPTRKASNSCGSRPTRISPEHPGSSSRHSRAAQKKFLTSSVLTSAIASPQAGTSPPPSSPRSRLPQTQRRTPSSRSRSEAASRSSLGTTSSRCSSPGR